jgi:hypothetical protein
MIIAIAIRIAPRHDRISNGCFGRGSLAIVAAPDHPPVSPRASLSRLRRDVAGPAQLDAAMLDEMPLEPGQLSFVVTDGC